MSAELWIRNADGDLQQILTLPSEGWTVEESAEEGNASQTQVAIPDPDLTIDPDHIIGWRRAIIYETDSEVANQVIFSGFVSIQNIGRTGGSFVEITGRVWNVSLVDMNTLWDQRLLRGTDTKRPAETDVERMTWLVATEEMGYFDDTSLISSADPENLDKRDTARTTCKAVADECSQQSGKNYWMGADSDGIFVWYANDSVEDYESPLRLSNDPADWDTDELADGTSLVWPISFDSVLDRDPNRVYDGAMVEYEGGATYRKNTATSAFFTLSGRDIDVPAPEIKTKAKAQRRGDRMLADLDTQNEVLNTTVRVPKGKCPMIRAGMRIAVRATHLPGWEDFGWARILSCSITAVQAGAYYDLGLKLQGPTTFVGIEGEDVTLVATNTVLEDSARNALDSDGTSTFAVGQVWRYTLTNTQHHGDAYTDAFALVWKTLVPPTSYTVIRAWGVSVYYGGGPDYPTTRPAQGTYPAFTACEDTGTFVVTAAGTGEFTMYAGANYPGSATIDEQWTCVLERLS